MLSKEIKAWAKNFFFTSVHIPLHTEFEPDAEFEEIILKTYKEDFILPVSKMLYNEIKDEIPQDEINAFLPVMRQCKLPNVIHYLKELVEDGTFCYTGYIEDDLSAAVAAYKNKNKEVFLITRESDSPFVGYASGGRILGSFVRQGLIILAETRRFPKGLNLKHLADQDPIRLTDFGVQVLRKAVNIGLISERDLSHTSYVIPEYDGTFQERLVSAMTERLPSYFVRKLISELPEATIKDAQSPYHAALEYAQQHPEDYRTALKELTEIISHADTPKAAGLTDDIVIKYINDKYGIPESGIRDFLMKPTTEQYYTSAYFLDKDSKDMSAEELMEKAAKDPNSVSGTLDELLIAFCDKENFDVTSSVEDLITFINGDAIMPNPVDIREKVKVVMQELNLPKEMTLEEFTENKEHVYLDDAQFAIDVINDTPWICESTKKEIAAALANGVPIVEKPSLEDELKSIQLPQDIMDAILVAKQTLEMYTPVVTSDEDVKLHLIRKGIPRTVVDELIAGKLPEQPKVDVDSEIKKKLETFYPAEWVEDILKGKGTPITEDKVKAYLEVNKESATEPVQNLKRKTADFEDNGYPVAESLLYDMRYAISTKDSDELRTEMLPVIYSYMRVLMMKKGDELDVVEFLNSKKSECSDEIAVFIDNAVNKLEGLK